MNESNSQCMQLIFSGIRFEGVNRSFLRQWYINGKVVPETQWNGKEKKKNLIYSSETAGEKFRYSPRKLFSYKYTHKFVLIV